MLRKFSKQSIPMLRKSQADAYITVYLSLSLTVILSLILALLQGARTGAVRMKSELVVDIAMNSALGEYNRALFDKYGLLFIEDSYGAASGTILNTREHIDDYFTKNFELSPVGIVSRRSTLMPARLNSVEITGYSLASDNNGSVLRRQIISYMEAAGVGAVIGNVQDHVNQMKSTGYDTTDVEASAGSNAQALSQPVYRDTDGNGENETYYADNPAGQVAAQKSIGILALAAPDISEISGAAVDSSIYASHRRLAVGTGLDDRDNSGAAGNLLFEKYILEKCGCYGHEKADSRLKYELEYIYAGKDSDYANLEKVVQKLFLWKEAANFTHIIGDCTKMSQARALALTASVLLTVPELEEAITMAVVFAWSFAETISDLRILLSGGKVPIVKTASSWNLSIENMLDFRNHLKNGGGSGLDYDDYLKMLVFMENREIKTKRLMDIIEMTIRKTVGNENFRIDNCIDVLCADFKITGPYNKGIEIERIYGYEMFD